MRTTEPDDDMDLPQERLVEMMFGVVADQSGEDTDEGGAAMTVRAPDKPSPLDSAVALPLPILDERE